MPDENRTARGLVVTSLTRNPIVQTALVVSVVLVGLLVSRAAVSRSTPNPTPEPQIATSPGGPLRGPGLGVSGADLDVEQCLIVDAGSSVVTRASPETSSAWVHANEGDTVRIDYVSASRSESMLIPQRDLAHEFAPGRVTVVVMGSDEPAIVTFVALSADARICGLAVDEA